MPDRSAVVIGGGISGVLTARELLRDAWAVTLLEGTHVGAGSSSRTAAGIRQQFSTTGTVRGMRYAVQYYKAFAADVEDGSAPIVQNGYLFLYDDEAAWADAQRRVTMQQRAGLTEVAALSADAVAARFPWVDRGAVIGGTHCPSDGFLRPHLIYNEGARRVRELGGTVVQNAPVTGSSTAGGRLTAVRTPKGDFSADLFLDCTNAWSPRLAPLLGAAPLPIAPRKRYLWFLARDGMPPETLAAMPLTITPQGTYCRPENPETLMMGRKHETTPDAAFSYDDQDQIAPAYSHTGGIDAVPFGLWAELAEVLPPLGAFGGFNATTSGYYAETPDHNPFLAFDPARPNLIRLVGFSGHGAMLGPFTAAAARALADAGSDVPSLRLDGYDIPMDAFAIGRAFDAREQMVI